MYNSKAKRNREGKIIHQEFQSKELPNTRIQSDRRWFGNTRVIGQKQLESFREEMGEKMADPYAVIIKEKKLPLSLLNEPRGDSSASAARRSLVATQPFADTFGKSQRRKRPKLVAESYEGLLSRAGEVEGSFADRQEAAGPAPEFDAARPAALESHFLKGQSKRIWGELYKVLDSSDVVIQVLDARDPLGTRSRFLEHHLRNNAKHKHMILLLNKCDLVPAWVTKRWLHELSREYPTLAFHASVTNPFGKGSLLGLLRQLSRLRSDKQYISVGLVGYPNVGKSSVINTLRSKKVCRVAPIPGETKVWQYITLTKKIFLIDCPGVVYNGTTDTESETILKGVVRVENLDDAADHVPEVLARVKRVYLRRAYRLEDWADAEDFLGQLARRAGKLTKGGEPDLNTVGKMVLLDWQRGRLPFFTLPPGHTEAKPEDDDAGPGEELVVGGVTEEEAASVPDGDPAKAAAAAKALAEAAALEIRGQIGVEIPVQSNFFDVQDGGEAGDGAGALSELDEEEDEEESSEEEDDEEDAGYGEGGLSWEAVLSSLQGDKAEEDD
ncbi:Nuclear/nucleolar GTPase 2 [Prototheca wickerhamii]|uniref:Nuclear/nucleolar GTPase 2 n=1 Tax=Prototheca wickerhamii TaxID=3111 RepID=A0AAD9MN20_PROWI|nr:Nuclear/nucleolar GTPase 2 [Prototheca wickerhamii]